MFNFFSNATPFKEIKELDILSQNSSDILAPIKGEYPFMSNFTTLRQQNYHYIDEGRGEILLFIHGNPTWSFLFRRMITALSSNYRVIAPDNIGFGLSSKPQSYDYTLETHIDNLEAFILKLDLRNITLVAHGYGSAIAMGCAVRHPQRFARFAMMNAFALGSPQFSLTYKTMRIPLIGKLLVCEFNMLVKLMMRSGTVTPMTHLAKMGYSLPYNTYENRIGPYRLFKDIPLSQAQYSLETLLQIEHGMWLFKEKPFMLIWGMKDNRFNSRVSLERWKTFYPHAEVLELDQAGHLLLEDAPVESIRFMKRFLEENPIDEF